MSKLQKCVFKSNPRNITFRRIRQVWEVCLTWFIPSVIAQGLRRTKEYARLGFDLRHCSWKLTTYWWLPATRGNLNDAPPVCHIIGRAAVQPKEEVPPTLVFLGAQYHSHSSVSPSCGCNPQHIRYPPPHPANRKCMRYCEQGFDVLRSYLDNPPNSAT